MDRESSLWQGLRRLTSRITPQRQWTKRSRIAVIIACAGLLIITPVFADDASLPSGAGRVISPKGQVVAMAVTPSGNGYWLVGSDGGVAVFGDAKYYGSLKGRVRTRIVTIAATPEGKGYWLVGSDGGVAAFGNARGRGSLQGRVRTALSDMAVTPNGKGYWLIGDDGGVAAFGNARVYGSLKGRAKSKILAIARTASGKGYWLMGSDGGVAAFGDAKSYGSLQGRVSSKVVDLVSTSNGLGYWLVAANGGAAAFGNAHGYGALSDGCFSSPAVGMGTSSGITGYFMVTADGQVRAFSPSSPDLKKCAVASAAINSSPEEGSIAADMFNRANAERAARGLPSLKWDSGLANSARSWSVQMGNNNNFAHSNIYPLLDRFQTAAENIGLGGDGTHSGQIHKAWMNSTGHRVNLLAPNLDVIGIGVYCSADGRMWSTQQFGRYVNSLLPSGFGPTPSASPTVMGDGGGPTC